MNMDIPKDIMRTVISPKIDGVVEMTGNKFGLHIDQIGDLDAAIRNILLGQLKSSDFTSHIMTNLEIDRAKAEQITSFMNTELFAAIKSELQAKTSPEPLTPVVISPLERAGNFSIEPEIPRAPIGKIDRASILSHIEGPTVPAGADSDETAHYEPLVDQLLNGPTSIPHEKIVRKPDIPLPPKAPTVSVPSAQPPRNLPTDDPYREAV